MPTCRLANSDLKYVGRERDGECKQTSIIHHMKMVQLRTKINTGFIRDALSEDRAQGAMLM
jgi:hypothetical protein